MTEVGMKRQEAGSSGLKVSNMATGKGRGPPEETVMWPTRNTLPAGSTYVILVALIAVVLFVAACTGPGHSSSTSSAVYPEMEDERAEPSGYSGGWLLKYQPAVAEHS